MSDLDATDPYARAGQIYPRLAGEMADRIARYGAPERLARGTLVFERGQRGVDFFLVIDGAIEIFEADEHNAEHLVTRHEAGQFTGELDLFNDREILVSGRAAVDTFVVRVKRADFRHMVSTEADIGEIMMRAFILRRTGFIRHAQGGVVIVGSGHAAHTLELVTFLTRNGHPHRLLDTNHDSDAEGLFGSFDIQADHLPVVLAPGDHVLRRPTIMQLADELGLTEKVDAGTVFDVAVVGAGPSGLAAAVYAASEGLNTIVIEKLAPGGQAGTSSRIENYLGFPIGISGQALAGRAQVQKFGARLAVSRAVQAIDCAAAPYGLRLEGDQALQTRSIIVATGARYRKLDVPGYERFEGQGIQYAATGMEASLCAGEEVVVVGGGNSAGQAAVFLSRTVAHVHMLVRGEGLAETMSNYLVERIDSSEKITLYADTEITALGGDDFLRDVTWTNCKTGEAETRKATSVFVMIGAEPNSEWLRGCLDLDERGFVLTGRDAEGSTLSSAFATSKPGIYAVGDVRSGSVKRVASGVGEGSVVVQAVHAYLNLDTH